MNNSKDYNIAFDFFAGAEYTWQRAQKTFRTKQRANTDTPRDALLFDCAALKFKLAKERFDLAWAKERTSK